MVYFMGDGKGVKKMQETIDIASKELWEKAKGLYLGTLSSQEERDQAERYLAMITSVTRENNDFVIFTTNEYAAKFLQDNYSDKLKKCLELLSSDGELKLVFKYSERTRPALVMPKPVEKRSVQKVSTFISTMPLQEEYTFEEFVRGPSNSWALAAAQGVVANPGKKGYNPLFIHGGTGLGKTHLMHAIGNELRRKNPSLAICYLTAETFLNEYINSLQNGQQKSFRDKYRSIDVLLVDDVQFLQRGKQCQEEFFNTFNSLQQAHKQIVMTSDVAPKNIPAIEERLISRFEGGMVQEIESPNYETRLAILRKKSEGMTPIIPDFALQFIADTIKSHVRAMEGALGKVQMMRMIDPTAPMNSEVLSRLLKEFIEKEQSMKKITIEEIQKLICDKFSITMEQMISMERTQSLVTPRQMAMYIARKFTTKSLSEMVDKFKKSHATIIHGVKNIEKRMDVEPELKNQMNEILSQLGYQMSDKMD